MTDREFIDNMKILLEPINNKLEMMENEMYNIRNDLRNMDFQNRREHREIRQDIETILAVLEAKNLLQKAQ